MPKKCWIAPIRFSNTMKFGSIVLAKNIFFSQAIEDMEEEFFKTQIHL